MLSRSHSNHGPSLTRPKARGRLSWLSCLLLIPAATFSQTAPRIQASGIVNAASYGQPLSPGSLAAIFGTNLAASQVSAPGVPLPLGLAGTTVLVNGSEAPLLFASPGQINFQLPSSAPTAYGTYTQATVEVTTHSGSSGPVQVPVYSASPSLFAVDGSGCGQAAALNVASDGTVSPNSPSNSAAPGDYISLYGTGAENFYPLPDGTYATGPIRLSPVPVIAIDGLVLEGSSYQYAGLAPYLVGVNQINIQIPPGVREGCTVPISINQEGLIGPSLALSIHSGRGQCVDPPNQSYGQISLMKTTSSGMASAGTSETFSATFPSAPALTMPQVVLPPAGAYITNISSLTPVGRTCKANLQLSAGMIAVKALATGQTVMVQPSSVPETMAYQQTLPDGFIEPGQYSITASGSPVSFQGTVAVGSPIQLQTTFPPGTTISNSEALVIRWSGGTPGTVVKVSLIAAQGAGGVFSRYAVAYADATAGSLTVRPLCTGGGGFCTFGLSVSNNAQIVVDVIPDPKAVTQTQAQGITESVQLSWVYRYVFAGLALQ